MSESWWGDPHQEAWDILDRDHLGIKARCHSLGERLSPWQRPPSWIEVLQVVGVEAYGISTFLGEETDTEDATELLEASQAPRGSRVMHAEDCFLVELSHLLVGTLGPNGAAELDRALDADSAVAIRQNIQAAGLREPSLARMAVVAATGAVATGGTVMLSEGTIEGAVLTTTAARRVAPDHAGPHDVHDEAADNGPLVGMSVAAAAWAAGAFSKAVSSTNSVFGASIGRLFPAIMMIMRQRLILACDSLELSDFALPGEVSKSRARASKLSGTGTPFSAPSSRSSSIDWLSSDNMSMQETGAKQVVEPVLTVASGLTELSPKSRKGQFGVTLSTPTEIRRRRTQTEALDEGSCVICLDIKANREFWPCRHAVCCSGCASSVRTCPICRAPIEHIEAWRAAGSEVTVRRR